MLFAPLPRGSESCTCWRSCVAMSLHSSPGRYENCSVLATGGERRKACKMVISAPSIINFDNGQWEATGPPPSRSSGGSISTRERSEQQPDKWATASLSRLPNKHRRSAQISLGSDLRVRDDRISAVHNYRNDILIMASGRRLALHGVDRGCISARRGRSDNRSSGSLHRTK